MLSNRERIAIWFAYTGMCLIWGTTWLAIKIGGHAMPVLTGVGLRFAMAGVLLYALAAVRGQLRPVREVPWKLVGIFATLLCGINYILIYVAETRIDSGITAVLFCSMPFFVFVFARVMIKERTTARALAGGLAAFAGIAIISLKGPVAGSPLFALAVVGSAASAAFANVYAKRHGAQPPLLTLPPAMLIAGTVELAAGIALEHPHWNAALSGSSLAALLYLAIFGSGIAFLLLIFLTQRLPAGVVGLAPLTYPVIAIAAGAFFGGEHVTLRELGGTALVVGGLALALLPKRTTVIAPRAVVASRQSMA
jgi:drug/metabolite transporter (DMT)-like permease